MGGSPSPTLPRVSRTKWIHFVSVWVRGRRRGRAIGKGDTWKSHKTHSIQHRIQNTAAAKLLYIKLPCTCFLYSTWTDWFWWGQIHYSKWICPHHNHYVPLYININSYTGPTRPAKKGNLLKCYLWVPFCPSFEILYLPSPSIKDTSFLVALPSYTDAK